MLAAHQVVGGLAVADDGEAVAVHQHLGGARPRVVGGGHHEAVRPRTANHEQVVPLQRRQVAVECEEVARLADRPHDIVVLAAAPLATVHRDLVVRLVVAGAEEVVHPRVHHGE